MGCPVQQVKQCRRAHPTPSTIPRVGEGRGLVDETAQLREVVRYPRMQFLDDGRRLSDTGAHHALQRARTIDPVDGRMNVVDLRLAHRSGRIEQQRLFVRKYGSRVGSACYERFRLVLEFLDAYQSQACESGLASSEQGMAVREECLDYLLGCPLNAHPEEIPRHALRRFLDEWGHRWM